MEIVQNKIGISQIHIIPFDLGYVFYDVLSIDNTKNILFAQDFVAALAKQYNTDYKTVIYNNIDAQFSAKKLTKVRFLKTEIADDSICFAKLTDYLFCYILTNGVGVFVLCDFDGAALEKYKHKDSIGAISKALITKIQKNVSQATILDTYKGDDVFPEEEKLMLDFRKVCWALAEETAKKNKVKCVRSFSSNIDYKSEGLSYVLTAYLFEENELTDKELNYVMYSPITKHVTEPQNWETLEKSIIEHDGKNKEYVLQTPHAKMLFSWSAVAIVLNKRITAYADIVESNELSTLIKTELYVQSRWFIADNSMDNVNKSYDCKLEELQRIESVIEFYQSELENDISANMNTLYKVIVDNVVETSSIRPLYKSVLGQIKTQKKIKEAHEQDMKKRNRFIANLFLAVFTASSFFKTILDVIAKEFSVLNIVLFAVTMVLAVGTIVFDYFNK